MQGYDLRYVGLDRLPAKLSEFDLNHYFTLTEADVQAIRDRFRSDRWVAAATQLLFLRACGRTLDQIGTIPRILLRQTGARLGVPVPSIASLRSLYSRYKTLYDHQIWAREYLGQRALGDSEKLALDGWLSQQAAVALSMDELIQAANHWLYEQKILIPADRGLRDPARAAWAKVERDLLGVVKDVVPTTTLEALEAALKQKREDDGVVTTLEWLKTPPKRHSSSTLAETLDKIRFLKGLGVHEWPLEAVPIAKQRAYAQQLQARRPSMTKRLKDSSRLLEQVFFLHITLLELTDSVLYQTGRRVSDLVRHAYNRTQSQQARSAVTYRQRLLDIKALVDDKERPAQERLDAIGTLLADLPVKPEASHAAIVRESLVQDGNRVRALLASLDDLDFAGDSNKEHALSQLALVRQLRTSRVTALPENPEISVNPAWQEMVEGPDRERALKALEACAMMGLRKELRRGSIWIKHSLSFRERDEMLIPPKQWAADRERYIELYALPASADAFLEKLYSNIEVGLAALDEACAAGKVTIDADGDIHLGALEALPDEATPRRTRDLIFKEIGDVQLPDLMLEMDALTNFSEILLARRAEDEDELIALYAGLLAHGTEIDAKSIAAMVPQLNQTRVSSAMRALEAQGRLRAANERMVEFQRQHAITEQWGTGETASSDMMSLDASKHLWYARVDPRRRTYAAGMYTHILDQHGIIYDQPVVLNERQAGVAIEGAIRHNEIRENSQVSLLAVDTHGYTNVAMALSKCSHVDLCPRLRDLKERKLYLPRGMAVPDRLTDAVAHQVSRKAIRSGWDEMLRLVASIRSGRVSAVIALQRFGSAARGDPLYRAADHLGKLLRTLYLCDFFSQPEFRREIHTILNRGESVHQLQRAVYCGKVPPERGRRKDEIIAISGAHTLLTNMIIAWNTHHMQTVVDKWRATGRDIEDAWLRRMGPAHFAHVNFRGTLRFAVGQYREALLKNATPARARARH